MNKNKLMKRTLAIVLSAAMVFTNIGHTPDGCVVRAKQCGLHGIQERDFTAMKDMIYSGQTH